MTADIVVVGGSGVSGRMLLGELVRRGADVAAVSQSAAGAERLRAAGVTTVVKADLADRTSLRDVFAGARAVYTIPPGLHQREGEFVINAVRAASAAGVRRFVFHSVLHPNTPVLRNHLRKAAAEVAVRESKLDWTILQPSIYGQVIFGMLNQPGQEVVVPFDPDQPLSVIDLSDLAEVGRRVLTEDGHTWATYELSGSSTTLARMLTSIAALRGDDELRAVRIGPTSAPLPPAAQADPMSAADIISTFAHYDRHGIRGNSAILEMLLGRSATTFEQLAERAMRGQTAVANSR